MKTVCEIDILGDPQLQRGMVAGSLGLFLVGVMGVLVGLALGVADALDGLLWLACVVGLSLAALPVHELIHGAAFRLLGGPGTRVRFGHQAGMLYATAPGTVYARGRFMAILLAPTVVLSLGFAGWGRLGGMPLAAGACLWVRLSGCVGDLLMTREIRREPECTHVRDTATGIALLRQ